MVCYSSLSLEGDVCIHHLCLFFRRESTKDNELGLTVEDWNLILRGAKRLVLRKDAVIVPENSDMQRIFQLVRGTCRIQMVCVLAFPCRLALPWNLTPAF